MRFEVFKDEHAVWHWRIVTRDTAQVIAVSPDSYASEEEAEGDLHRVAQSLSQQLKELDD